MSYHNTRRPKGKMGQAFDRGVTARQLLEQQVPGATTDENLMDFCWECDEYRHDAPRRSQAFRQGFRYMHNKLTYVAYDEEEEEDYYDEF